MHPMACKHDAGPKGLNVTIVNGSFIGINKIMLDNKKQNDLIHIVIYLKCLNICNSYLKVNR